MPLPALPYLMAGVGVGVYIKGGSLKESAFWAGTTWAASYAIVHPIKATTMVARGAKYGFTTSLQTMGADVLASRAAQMAAGAALGYGIGAVTGTAVVSVAEKKGIVYEGATQDVLGFYGFDAGGQAPHYWDQGDKPTPGYFNIPGNVGYIWRHYTS